MKWKCVTKSATQTKRFGEALAKQILKKSAKEALVIGLTGNLGGGKTTFLQGFARGLGVQEKVLSPTFVIYKRFRIQAQKFRNFYHFDCYRLNSLKEILALGFKEAVKDPENIIVIEWADRIAEILPQKTIFLKFKFIDKNTREIWVYF